MTSHRRLFHLGLLIAAVVAFSLPQVCVAEDAIEFLRPIGPFTPLTGLPENFQHSFVGNWRLGAQIGAFGVTWALSSTGVDSNVYRDFQNGRADDWAHPAVLLGYVLAPATITGMYFASRFNKDEYLETASFAAFQASAIALGYVSAMKFLSGRPQPLAHDPDYDRFSREFDIGFGRRGLLNGWPSGHAAIIAALTSSVAAYYDTPALWWSSVVISGYVGIAMSVAQGATQHWFSDCVAGELVGFSIGTAVGEGFRKRANPDERPATVTWFPSVERGGAGVRLWIALN